MNVNFEIWNFAWFWRDLNFSLRLSILNCILFFLNEFVKSIDQKFLLIILLVFTYLVVITAIWIINYLMWRWFCRVEILISSVPFLSCHIVNIFLLLLFWFIWLLNVHIKHQEGWVVNWTCLHLIIFESSNILYAFEV